MRAYQSLNVIVCVLVLVGFAVSQERQYREVKIIPPFQGKWGKGSPVSPLASAQWKDGGEGQGWVKPDPNFKPKHTPDGQVDIQGVWASVGLRGGGQVPISQVARELEQQKAGNTGQAQAPPPPAPAPREPSRFAIPDERPVLHADMRAKTSGRDKFAAGGSSCLPIGMTNLMSYLDFQILQTPGDVLIISEHLTNFRHVPLDGRPPLSETMKLWMGDSRGRWQGNTLTIDTKNNNDKAVPGNSDALYMQERLTPIAHNILQYEASVEDPIVYSKGMKKAFPLILTPNYEMFEENCSDGNRYAILMFKSGMSLYPGFKALVEMNTKK